jgi:CBS domain-containing protein
MKVSELMTRDVASVRADESAAAAARIMWDCDCGVAPVLDAEGRIVAMITDRDICMAAMTRDQPPSAIRVSEVMSKSLVHCRPDDTVASAERLMRSRQVRRLPVVDDDRRLIGLLSLADIVRAAEPRTGQRERDRDLAPDEIAATLAEICAPVVSTSAAPPA